MRAVDLIYFDAGGGHRAAATALKSISEKQGRPWQMRMVHLQDVLAPADVFKKVLRIDLQEIYNQMLRRGWTLGSEQGLRFMQGVIRLYHGSQVRLLEDWWHQRSGMSAPDAVVSVVPNFNRALFDGLQNVRPDAPYVTVLTDLADFPPHFWVERQDQYVIAGTRRAYQQALELGYSKARVFPTSGMILNPRFYEPVEVDVAAARKEMGLDAERPTVLVLFGGFGSNVMSDIVSRLDASGLDLQLILVAGKNENLRARLAAQQTRIKKHVMGFTSEIPRLMKMSDFFIGKPGPGSVSEAVHMGLPVITVRNAWTLPQERYNAEWLVENNLGLQLKSFREIADAARGILQPGRLDGMRAAARGIENRAIFEIPDLLEQIFSRH